MGFGSQLREVLAEINMSVATLSKETKIPAPTLYSIINKDIDSVGIDKVKKIEHAIGAVPGGILYNLLYGIEPGEENLSTRIHDYYRMDDDSRKYWMVSNYDKLNSDAQCKVAAYVEDLTKISEYLSVKTKE